MATIDSKKLLPPSKSSGSSLTTQKFLVPISNIKVKSSAIIKASDITPGQKEEQEQSKNLRGEIVQISNKVVSIEKIIGKNNSLFKGIEENKRKLLEKQKYEKREKELEKKEQKQKGGASLPSLPRTGFLDAIKRFLFFTLLGTAFVKFGKHIPKIVEFSKKLIPAFKFLENFAGNVLNGVVDFIGAGYKAYDKIREITKNIGGEDLQKKFDEFSNQFNTFANLALIAGMSTMGGTDFGGSRGKPSTSKPGFDRVRGGKVDRATQSRYLSRYGKTAFTDRFGQKSLKGLTGKGVGRIAGKALGRVPIIGGLVDFIISTVIFKEKPGRAAAKAVGATIGSALGSFIPVPFAGTILGGVVGDLVGGALYDSLVGKENAVAKAQGGQVTRGGKKVGGPAKRVIKKVRAKPPKIKPQKSIPGKDVGGKKQIEKLFPSPLNTSKRNPLGVLESTSTNLKKIPLLGGIMGASIDLTMGQKPDQSTFKKVGYGFGSLIQSAIDAENSAAISNIQREIVGLAGGGAVPRTLSSNENIGMKIGERLARTLDVMVNSKVTETLQSIRQQFGKEGFDLTGQGGPGGLYEVLPAEISEDQRKASGDLINYFEKLYGKNAAIGIVANLLRESGLRTRTPDNNSFEGMAQWSRNDRWPKLVSWAESKGKDPYSRSTQAEWIAIELKQLGTDSRLKKAESADAAASLFYNEFERAAYSKPILGNRYNPDNPHERKNRAFVSSLMGGSASAPAAMVTGGLTPSSIPLTSGQGWRWGKMHKGIDLDGGDGAPISSAQDAKVVWAGDKGDDYGNSVILKYSNGSETRFAHLKSVNVRTGQSIKAGQLIGRQGNTGSSTASHLHFEYYPSGGAMSYRGYGNAASVMNSYFRYGGNVKPKPLQKPADSAGTPPKKSTPSSPSQQRTMILGGKSWTQHPVTKNWTDQFGNKYSNPDFQNRLIQERKGAQASLAPSTSTNIAEGLNKKSSYESSTLAILPVLQPLLTPVQSTFVSTPIDNRGTSSINPVASLVVG